MTTQEAMAMCPICEYTTSIGDNLTRIVRLLYGNDNNKAYETIKELNLRYDWSYIQGGEKIKYFSEDVLSNIDVIYGER